MYALRQGAGDVSGDPMVESSNTRPEEDERQHSADEWKPRRRHVFVKLKRHRSTDDVPKFRRVISQADMQMKRDEWEASLEMIGQMIQMRIQQAHLQRVAALMEGVTHSLSSTNAILEKHISGYQSSIDQIDMQTVKLVGSSNEDGPRAVQTLRLVMQLDYQLDNLKRSLGVIRQGVRDKRQALWEARKQVVGKKKPNTTSVAALRSVEGVEVPVDSEGRTQSEAEDEAALLGYPLTRPPFESASAPEEGMPWWRNLFSSWAKGDKAAISSMTPEIAEESGRVEAQHQDLIDFASEDESYMSASSGMAQ